MRKSKTSTLLFHHLVHTFLLFTVVQCGSKLTISTAKELVVFSESVNTGTTYNGTTVLLADDVDFTAEGSLNPFTPIGSNTTTSFTGTFDGQGHTISCLTVNASSGQRYAGLFGFVVDSTIKNVVLDSSCSISSYSDAYTVYFGGVVGEALADKNDIVIESVVNMGIIAYSGDNTGTLLISGGIVGCVSSTSSSPITAIIRNCANYGSVTDTRANSTVNVGGIVGLIVGSSSFSVFIQNSANYGYLKLSGGSGSAAVGGIVGVTQDIKLTVIENCLSAGNVTSVNANAGSIIGFGPYLSFYGLNITNCFWTERANTPNGTCGRCGRIKYNTTNASLAEENSTIVVTLNNHASANTEWNKWVFVKNTNTANITFHVNGGKVGFTFASHILLLPDPAGGPDHAFSGWFTDSACTTPFTVTGEGIVGIDESTVVLFGGWNLSVSFNSTNSNMSVEPSSKNVVCGGTYGELPTPNATGFTFCGWSICDCEGGSTFVNSSTKVEEHVDHTIYACWTPSSYSSSSSSSSHVFNSTLHDVKLEFNERDLTKDDAKKIIDRHTDDYYEIIEISNGSEGTTVIVRFADPSNAENFVRAIKDSSDLFAFKRILYMNETLCSLSPFLLRPLLWVLSLIL